MKKIAALFMTLLVLGIAGCGDKDKPAQNKPQAKPAQKVAVVPNKSIASLSGKEQIKQLYLDYHGEGGREFTGWAKARRDSNTIYLDGAKAENWKNYYKMYSDVLAKEIENLKEEKVTAENEKFKNVLNDYLVKNRAVMDLLVKEKEAEISKTPHSALKTKVADAKAKRVKAEIALNKAYYVAMNGKDPETLWAVNMRDEENRESAYYIADNFDGVKVACTAFDSVVGDIDGIVPKGQFTLVKISLKNDTKDIISINADSLKFIDKNNNVYKPKFMLFNDAEQPSLKLRPRVSNYVEYFYDIPKDVLIQEGRLELAAPFVKNGPVKLEFSRRVR